MTIRHARAALLALALTGYAAGASGAAGGQVYLSNQPGPSPAYVPQAGRAPAASDPYVTQTPADARRRPPAERAVAPSPRPKAPARRAAEVAATVEVPGGAQASFPSVGTSVRIVLHSPALDGSYPSVGAGVSRR